MDFQPRWTLLRAQPAGETKKQKRLLSVGRLVQIFQPINTINMKFSLMTLYVRAC